MVCRGKLSFYYSFNTNLVKIFPSLPAHYSSPLLSSFPCLHSCHLITTGVLWLNLSKFTLYSVSSCPWHSLLEPSLRSSYQTFPFRSGPTAQSRKTHWVTMLSYIALWELKIDLCSFASDPFFLSILIPLSTYVSYTSISLPSETIDLNYTTSPFRKSGS